MSIVSRRAHLADAAFAAVIDFICPRATQSSVSIPTCAISPSAIHTKCRCPGWCHAIRERAQPQDKNWFAYKTSEEEPQAFLAERVGRELGLAFEPRGYRADDRCVRRDHGGVSPGARYAAMKPSSPSPRGSATSPACLPPMAVPRKVRLKRPGIRSGSRRDRGGDRASKTRLVIVNTPHNPTGRIYGRDTLEKLADLLDRASAGSAIASYLLSDEPYRRLRFDGWHFDSPAAIYPWTFISYSYGKVLLAPGQRLGYLAISPLMPLSDRRALRDAMFSAQMALGWCFPNAVMQYAVPDLEALSIDQAALARRRDQLIGTLSARGLRRAAAGGHILSVEQMADGDPERHWNALADRKVFVLPGSIMGSPGYLRISLTASDRMVEQALPAFAAITSA